MLGDSLRVPRGTAGRGHHHGCTGSHVPKGRKCRAARGHGGWSPGPSRASSSKCPVCDSLEPHDDPDLLPLLPPTQVSDRRCGQLSSGPWTPAHPNPQSVAYVSPGIHAGPCGWDRAEALEKGGGPQSGRHGPSREQRERRRQSWRNRHRPGPPTVEVSGSEVTQLQPQDTQPQVLASKSWKNKSGYKLLSHDLLQQRQGS